MTTTWVWGRVVRRLGQLVAADGVETRGGFVEDEDAGIHGQDRGDRGATSLAATEAVGGAVGDVGRRHRGERGVDTAVDLFGPEAEVGGAERHVVANGVHEQLVVGVLEHEADTAADLRDRGRTERETVDGDRAAAWCQQSVHVQGQRGLAGPVRPEDRDALAGCDPELEVVEDQPLRAGVGERELVDLDGGWCAHVRASAVMPAAASMAGVRASAQSRRVRLRGSKSGIVPVKPRATMASWTRSPRS